MSDDEEVAFDQNNDDLEYGEEAADVSEIEEEEDDIDENVTPAAPSIVREIIIERDGVTSDRVSLFEYTELVSIRAESIARNNICFVNVDGLVDPIKMAEREFAMRMCPLLIKRYLGERVNGDGEFIKYYEYVNPNTAVHPSRAVAGEPPGDGF